METISKRLNEAMNKRNIKAADLVKKTGISKGALSSYLSGRYLPKSKYIYKLAAALDVNPTWLLGYDVPMETEIENQDFNHEIFELRIKSILNEKDMSIDDLIKKCNEYDVDDDLKLQIKITIDDLKQFFNNQKKPSESQLALLSIILDVDTLWLMGYNVPREDKLKTFLKGIKYEDIDKIVLNDKNKKIISYFNDFEIITDIYLNKYDESYNNMCLDYENSQRENIRILKSLKEKKSLKFLKKMIEDISHDDIYIKKIKLILSIKKYYTKLDMLKELDNRITFDEDANFKRMNETQRLKTLEINLLNLEKELNKNNNNQDKGA